MAFRSERIFYIQQIGGVNAGDSLRNVTKRFGDVHALRGIDLTVESGEVFGFLGPNGAGKSTTIDILLHYTHPSSGSVDVLGHDVTEAPVAVRERVGILPEASHRSRR